MADFPRDYASFLARLSGYERLSAQPQARGPDKLAGMRWLVERLNHPEQAGRVVHIAGTNGKGMTSTMIANLLHAAGHSVGLYTSPHVLDLRERIVINGQWISERQLAQLGHAVLDLADGAQDRLYCSYFDLLTAMGLAAFRDQAVEWVVLETGLGGLADATNIGPKALAVITRIGMDHMAVLGNTLREIATEKLGIVRPGVPTVLAAQGADLQPWMESEIRARGSQPVAAWDWSASLVADSAAPQAEGAAPPQNVHVAWPDGAVERLTDLPAVTQAQLACAGAALAAAETVLGPAVGAERARRARVVLQTRLPGRLERRFRQRVAGTELVLDQVVLDGGHNADALRMLAGQLDAWGLRGYTLIFGTQADKLVPEALPALARLVGAAARVLIVAPQTARAASAEALQRFVGMAMDQARALQAGVSVRVQAVPLPAVPVQAVPHPRAALRTAGDTPQRPVVITGSFWMLGDMMRLLGPA